MHQQVDRQENAALAFNRQHLLDARGSRAYATSRASSLASHDSLIVRDEEAGQYAAPQ
ncbi:MAG: hypothetical protein K0S29_128 [Gammaproteobacteria bacterium]|nr:hypothetical protein [Gammaproteobacteria bacterium]